MNTGIMDLNNSLVFNKKSLSKKAYNDIRELVDQIGLTGFADSIELNTIDHEDQDYKSFQYLKIIQNPYMEAFNVRMIGDQFLSYRDDIREAHRQPYVEEDSISASAPPEPEHSLKAFGMPDRPQHMITLSALNEGNIYEDTVSE